MLAARNGHRHPVDLVDGMVSISPDEVVIVQWPADEDQRRQLEFAGIARILVVPEDTPPPADCSLFEDWIRQPFDDADLEVRIETVRARVERHAPLQLDDANGLLRKGRRWTALPAIEFAVLRDLLAHRDLVVSVERLCDAARSVTGAEAYTRRTLLSTMHRLRKRTKPFGIRIHAIRQSGYLLEVDTAS